MPEQLLEQPFPHIRNRWRTCILTGLFIALFMLFFQPFGLSEYQSRYKYLIQAGYGAITFVILAINLFVWKFLFPAWHAHWTVKKQIISVSITIFTIGLGNFAYSAFIFPVFFDLKGLLVFQGFTVVVGIFPVVIQTLISQNMKLSGNLKLAREMNDLMPSEAVTTIATREITLWSENEKDQISLDVSALIYIESVGNYVEVHFWDGALVKKSVLRSTIKRMEAQLTDFPAIQKCHRAYIINLNQVDTVKGNSQGLRILLKNLDMEIPVSRNLSQDIKEALR